jgi:hypothetical protein
MKQLYANFDEIIPKEHKFYNYLLRVLNKKIKRKKRVEGEETEGTYRRISSCFSKTEFSII